MPDFYDSKDIAYIHGVQPKNKRKFVEDYDYHLLEREAEALRKENNALRDRIHELEKKK